MKTTIHKISKFFFLILFTGFLGSTSLFNHAHCPYGRIIVHSHPYKAGQDGQPLHSHSDAGFQLVYLMNNIVANVSLIFTGLLLVLFFYRQIITPAMVTFTFSSYKRQFFLRGPPAFLY